MIFYQPRVKLHHYARLSLLHTLSQDCTPHVQLLKYNDLGITLFLGSPAQLIFVIVQGEHGKEAGLGMS